MKYRVQETKKFWWGRDFLHPTTEVLGPTQPLYNGYRVIPGSKAAEEWR